jgi:hypothetical protein
VPVRSAPVELALEREALRSGPLAVLDSDEARGARLADLPLNAAAMLAGIAASR